MKRFIRELAARQPAALVEIYATITPKPKGKPISEERRLTMAHLRDIGAHLRDIGAHLRDIARGTYRILSKMHEHGFAHNDIKPENIFFDRESGEVTLIDTGLMQKHSAPRIGHKLNYLQSKATQGTPAYMSPRAEKGEPHGTETDLYSLACTLLVAAEPAVEMMLLDPDIHHEMCEVVADPKKYLTILIDALKRHEGWSKVRAGEELEERLKQDPDFENAIVDCFIGSFSHTAFNSRAARDRLEDNPYLNAKFSLEPDDNLDLPFLGRRNVDLKKRIAGVDSETAMEMLSDLHSRVEHESGVLKLRHADGSSWRMTIEWTKWYQAHKRGSSAMEETSVLLRGLFQRKRPAGCHLTT